MSKRKGKLEDLLDEMFDSGWVDSVMLFKGPDGKVSCSLFTDRLGPSPYRYCTIGSAGGAIRAATDSVIATQGKVGKKRNAAKADNDDFI